MGSSHIKFDLPVLDAIESDIRKCRETRELFRNLDFQKYGYRVLTDVCDDSFRLLSREANLVFDPMRYPLGESFATMLGMEHFDLPSLHLQYSKDSGRLKDRDEKRKLLKSVLDPAKRKPFQDVFINFVLKYVAPHVHLITQSTRIYFQCFPCIRVVRPGEFSIGPHCDASYGFSQSNINFYIPLTKIFGTNSLILESSPGLEDWHTIELEYGGIKRFYGSQCSHFTAENTTTQTRISLDFRVIPGELWLADHDHFASSPGYYTSCTYVPHVLRIRNIGDSDLSNVSQMLEPNELKGPDPISHDLTKSVFENTSKGEWVLEEDLLAPDWRVGFPFEK